MSKGRRGGWTGVARELLLALVGARRQGSGRGAIPRQDFVAALLGRKKRRDDATETALGVALASGLALAGSLYAKPSVRASIRSAGRRMWQGQGPEQRGGAEIAGRTADRIVHYLEIRRIAPLRIAVDGLPGSGKTTLARALARRLDLRHVSLDHRDMTRTLDLSAPRAVYEHHRLLRTQDLDGFDALCYLDLPVREIRRRLEERGRGAFLLTLFDFELMKRIGDVAFALCDGGTADMGEGVRLKLRPAAGYRVIENLWQLAEGCGVEPSSHSREELMFLCASGRARQGLRAYLNREDLRDHLGAAAVAALHQVARSDRGR